MSGRAAGAWRGRDVWVFDLDNTLYPANHAIFEEIGERMTAYIARRVDCDHAGALALREAYFNTYGATVVGLVKHHGVDAADFLRDVHDVALDSVEPDPELAALIARLPGRRIVFTNGARDYARRILARLGVASAFEAVFTLEDAGLVPKPEPEAFRRLVNAHAINPARAVMIEDHARNLAPAAALGFATVLVGPEETTPAVRHRAASVHAFLRGVIDELPLTASA